MFLINYNKNHCFFARENFDLLLPRIHTKYFIYKLFDNLFIPSDDIRMYIRRLIYLTSVGRE